MDGLVRAPSPDRRIPTPTSLWQWHRDWRSQHQRHRYGRNIHQLPSYVHHHEFYLDLQHRLLQREFIDEQR